MKSDTHEPFSAGRCDACGSERGPLLKLSLGKDFFGRSYDRLSPSADQSPRWYCETCSLYKNLQRDFRDIRAETDKASKGQPSELGTSEQVRRAHLRLREIAALLNGHPEGSRLLDPADVHTLLDRIQAQAGSPSSAG